MSISGRRNAIATPGIVEEPPDQEASAKRARITVRAGLGLGGMTVSASVQLRIVGQVETTRTDGIVIELPSPKAQAATARLVVDRLQSGTPRGELASVIWPGGPPDTWESALRSILTRVRRFLDASGLSDSEIIARNGRYLLRLPDAVRIDLEQLERVAATFDADTKTTDDVDADGALQVTSRVFLPDNDSLWAHGVRQRINELRSACLEASSQQATASRDASRAVALAREAVRHSALRESAHRALMRAHWAAGNRAEALATFHQCKRFLAEEVGVPPSQETTELYTRMLGEVTGKTSERKMSYRPPFLGRAADLEALNTAWAGAQNGQTHLVLVTGQPGIGKTRLLQELVRRSITGDDLVLWCHGQGADPSRPALQAGLAFLRDATGESNNHLGATIDDAVDRTANLGAPSAAVLRRALGNLAQSHGPLLLLLDDFGELDEPSMIAIRDVVVESDRLPLLVIATIDAPRLDDRRRVLLRQLERACTTGRRELHRLGVVAAHDLAWHLCQSPSPSKLDEVLEGSGGNPHLLQLLAGGDLHDTARQRALDENVDRRLAGLSSPASRLLQACALAGTDLDIDVVRHLAGLTPEETHVALSEILAHDLLVQVGERLPDLGDGRRRPVFGFAHGAVKDVLYSRISGPERGRLHSDLCEQIWTRRPDSMAAYTGWLTRHLSEAGLEVTSTALDGYLLAAARAEQDGAMARSADLYAAAFALLPESDTTGRARIGTYLGLASLRAGRDTGVECLTAAVYDAVISEQPGLGMTAATAVIDAWIDPESGPSARDLSGQSAQLDEARAMVELVVDHFQNMTVAEHHALRETTGHFLAQAITLGTSVSPSLVRRSVTELSGLLTFTIDPRQSEHRFRISTDLLILAEEADDAEAQFEAVEHGLAAATVLGCPERRREFTGLWAQTALTHEDQELVRCRRVEFAGASGAQAAPGPVSDGPIENDRAVWRRQQVVNRWLRFHVLGERITEPENQGQVAGRSLNDVSEREAEPAGHTHRATGGPDLATIVDQALTLSMHTQVPQVRHLVALAVRCDTRPLDESRLHSLGVLALVVAEVGNQEQIELVLARLATVTHLVCSQGHRSFVGPVAAHQGRLHARLGRWDDAERFLLSALTTVANLPGQELWVVLLERELAAVLEKRNASGDRAAAAGFRREADQMSAVFGRFSS